MKENSKEYKLKKSLICEYDLDGNYIRTWLSPIAVSHVYPIGPRAIQNAARSKDEPNASYGRQWRYYKETLGEAIAPITNKHVLKYNKHCSYDKVIAKEYLYETPKKGDTLYYLDLINSIAENKALNTAQRKMLEELKNYFENN